MNTTWTHGTRSTYPKLAKTVPFWVTLTNSLSFPWFFLCFPQIPWVFLDWKIGNLFSRFSLISRVVGKPVHGFPDICHNIPDIGLREQRSLLCSIFIWCHHHHHHHHKKMLLEQTTLELEFHPISLDLLLIFCMPPFQKKMYSCWSGCVGGWKSIERWTLIPRIKSFQGKTRKTSECCVWCARYSLLVGVCWPSGYPIGL